MLNSGTPAVPATEIAAALENAVAEVLETMLFTAADETIAEYLVTEQELFRVRVRFSGPLAGELYLSLEQQAAKALAGTFLGVEPDELTTEHQSQLAAEMANMICGSVLSHIEPYADITLGAPEAALARVAQGTGIYRAFRLPEGQVAVEFRLNGRNFAHE